MKMIVHRHLLCLNLFRFVKLVNLYVTNLLQSFSEKFFLGQIYQAFKIFYVDQGLKLKIIGWCNMFML